MLPRNSRSREEYTEVTLLRQHAERLEQEVAALRMHLHQTTDVQAVQLADIRQQRDALKQQQNSQAHDLALFRSLAEYAPYGVMLSRTDGSVTYCNAAYHAWAGHTVAAVRQIADAFADDPATIQEILSSVVAQGSWQGRLRLRSQHAEAIPVHVAAQMLAPVAARAPVLLLVLRDITDLLRAERALDVLNCELEQRVEQRTAELREREAYYRALVHNAADLISISDASGIIRHISPSVSRLLGYHPDEMIGHSGFDFVHPDDVERVFEAYSRHVAGTVANTPSELRFRHRDGTWRYLEAVTTNLLDDPTVQGVIINARDITARKHAEEQHAMLSHAVQQATDAMLVTNANLDESGPQIVFLNQAFCQMAGCDAHLDHAVEEAMPTAGLTGNVSALFGAYTGPALNARNTFAKSFIMAQLPRMLHGLSHDHTMVQHLRRLLHSGEACTGETVNTHHDGSSSYVEWHISPIRDSQGKVTHFISLQRDVTARKQAETFANDQRAFLESLIKYEPLTSVFGRLVALLERQRPGMRAAIQVIHEGRLTFAAAPGLPTGYVEALSSLPIDETEGPGALAATSGANVFVTDTAREPRWPQWRLLARAHQIRAYWVVPVRVGNTVLGNVTLCTNEPRTPDKRDITLLETVGQMAALAMEQSQLSDQIAYHAYYDALTGLPNRARCLDRLQQAIHQARQQQHLVAVCFIDLDRFKQINDTLGHPVGDSILRQAAARLQSQVADHDTLARMGDDTFALILPRLHTVHDAMRCAQGVLQALAEPFIFDERELFMTASIGISFYPQDGTDAVTLLKHADHAVHRAKTNNTNTLVCFAPEMTTFAMERLDLEQQLRRALEQRELVLYYQPQIDLQRGEIVGVEALLRWQHPQRGMIAPGEFIPLAEESGLIIPIGAWIIDEVCRQAVAWDQAGLPPLRVAVNVSARQLVQNDFVEHVAAALERSGLDPARLDLEITESMMMQDQQAHRHQIEQAHALGVQVSIDDFGTGYSSLAYLQQFPVDCLKIDKSFVHTLDAEPTSATDPTALVQTIVTLARNFRLRVIAEGVETTAQRDFLQQIGCDEGQGFLFERPVPAADLATLLRAAHPGPVAS
jgi:diguanylate cyclase (GGDEF)-like protein/PAS domain S-box-containing protein